MIVQALQGHRAASEVRHAGTIFQCAEALGKHLIRSGYAKLIASAEDWHTPYGRELRTEPLTDRPWPAVVACLNIWNDRPALEQTLPTWINRVDALVVADGAYKGTDITTVGSTDGLDEYLAGIRHTIPIFRLQSANWPDQAAKRTALLQHAAQARPDALLLIIDADEFVSGEMDLHAAPEGDVIWLTLTSPLYQRPYGQPRLIRAQPGLEYRGRHHWLYAGDRLLATHQYGGPGVEHRLVSLAIRNQRGLGHSAERAQVKTAHMQAQHVVERVAATPQGKQSDAMTAGREALRIASFASYDPGMVAFRLHTAINTTTPHASVFFRRGLDNPFQAPRQYDVDQAPAFAHEAAGSADVVHCHLDYAILDAVGGTSQPIVIHHHGSVYRMKPGHRNEVDKRRAALRLVSNLELLSYGENLHWLPNPVSVARLRRLRQSAGLGYGDPPVPFRVAHSPSKRHLKGTDAFLTACDNLRAKNGLDIEPVLIEGLPHSEALRLKATCDACFDSFWLGIQCSGIEAAAMGLPVIAGDVTVRDRYIDLMGLAPYTFAADGAELEIALARLIEDRAWRAEETARVSAYVETWHDDAAVALRYLDLLDTAINWRGELALNVPRKKLRQRAKRTA